MREIMKKINLLDTKDMIHKCYLLCYEQRKSINNESDFKCWMHRFLWEHIEQNNVPLRVLTEVPFSKESGLKADIIILDESDNYKSIIELKYTNKRESEMREDGELYLSLQKKCVNDFEKMALFTHYKGEPNLFCFLLYHIPFKYKFYQKVKKLLQIGYTVDGPPYKRFKDYIVFQNGEISSIGKIDTTSNFLLLCDRDQDV